MTSSPGNADEVARRIWTEALQRSADPGSVLVVADELLTVLEAGLRRWIGAEGFAALLGRSVALTRPHHAALGSFADLESGPAALADPPDSREHFSSIEMSEAIIALLVAMMEQLGSIIGVDMAVRLLASSGTPSSRGSANPEPNENGS